MSAVNPTEVIETMAMHRVWKWSAIPEHSYAFCWCGEKLATVEAHAAHVVSKLTDAGYSIMPSIQAEKKARPVRDQPDLNPNNLPLLGPTIPVAALDGIRVVANRWLKKRLEEGIAGSNYAAALEHCADELDAAITMVAAAAEGEKA